MIETKTIESTDREKFEETLATHIREGWNLVGFSTATTHDDYRTDFYYTAVLSRGTLA